MKIRLFFAHPSHGGIENVLGILAHSLMQYADVEVASFLPQRVQEILAHTGGEANSHDLKIVGLSSKGVKWWNIYTELRASRPDVILTFQGALSVSMAGILGLHGIPLVVRESNSPSGVFGSGPLACAKVKMKRFVYRRADAVVALSEHVCRDVLNLGIKSDKITVIYNPVRLEHVRQQAQQSAQHEWLDAKRGPVIVTVGRLTPQKDLPTLLKAFSIVSEADFGSNPAQLVIVGDGAERDTLEKLSAELGVSDRVAFVGFQTNPHKFVAKADMFVLSSLYEGMPNSLVEAMACGTPCIASNAPGGSSEVLLGGDAGVLFPVGDWRALAAYIIALLKNPEARRKLAATATASIGRFDEQHITDAYFSLLRRMTNK